MSKPRRIGVFGGTFDPVHEAHLDIARAALSQAGLDLVLFVVSARPPHKYAGPLAPPQDRYDMVAAAIASESQMGVSRIELDREGPSFMVETMEELSAHFADASFWLILGMDSLVDFPRWKEPAGILRLANILVVPRPGEWKAPPELEGHYELLPFSETRLSSTEVRRRIEAREPLDLIVPPAVMAIIQDRGLYGTRRIGPTGH